MLKMTKIGVVCAAALFACMQGQSASVLDITFGRVWEGRKVFDAEIPFPKGVSFLPAAHYAAPADVAPPYTLHLALACRHRVAVFAEKDGEVRLSRIDDWPEGFDPRPAANLTSLRVVPGGGAGTVAATLSAGIGQAADSSSRSARASSARRSVWAALIPPRPRRACATKGSSFSTTVTESSGTTWPRISSSTKRRANGAAGHVISSLSCRK